MSESAALADLLLQLVRDPRTGLLLLLLLAAALIDLKTLRLPNPLTVGGMVLGLLVNAIAAPTPWSGLALATTGLVIGLLLLLPLWLLRILGAGDVKLMAAVGAFLGPSAVLGAALYVVIAGGIAALVVAAFKGSLGRLLQNLQFVVATVFTPAGATWRDGRVTSAVPSVGKLPYGLCICLGSAAYLVARQLGFA